VDLLERPLPTDGVVDEGPDEGVSLALRPFQVVTLRFSRS
jgi:alpha-mannosidase